MDDMTFKLLSEKLFFEFCRIQYTEADRNWDPGLIAHLACDATRAYLIKRDAMLDFTPVNEERKS